MGIGVTSGLRNLVESVARSDIDWRAAGFIAIGYLALSAFNFVFALPIANASLALLATVTFLSGPAGFLFAFVTMPDRFFQTIACAYVVGTCLLAPFVVRGCHRQSRVSKTSRTIAVSLWFAAGFIAITYVFAFAA